MLGIVGKDAGAVGQLAGQRTVVEALYAEKAQDSGEAPIQESGAALNAETEFVGKIVGAVVKAEVGVGIGVHLTDAEAFTGIELKQLIELAVTGLKVAGAPAAVIAQRQPQCKGRAEGYRALGEDSIFEPNVRIPHGIDGLSGDDHLSGGTGNGVVEIGAAEEGKIQHPGQPVGETIFGIKAGVENAIGHIGVQEAHVGVVPVGNDPPFTELEIAFAFGLGPPAAGVGNMGQKEQNYQDEAISFHGLFFN